MHIKEKLVFLGWLALTIAVIFTVIFIAVTLIVPPINRAFNHRTIKTISSSTVSYTQGAFGHIDYTVSVDGFEDIKAYPKLLGHRYFESKLYQNIDGDNTVDRIRINGPEWKMNQLKGILIRKFDLTDHQQEFIEADEILRSARQKYREMMEK